MAHIHPQRHTPDLSTVIVILLRIHREQAAPPGVKPLPDWLPRLGALVSMGFLAYSLWQFLWPP